MANGRHVGLKAQIWSKSPEEFEEWRQAAEIEGMSLSAWLRRAANRAVENEARQREVLS